MSVLPLLAIDTAAPRLQLALLRADGTADVSVDDMAQGHAELLFPRLEALLKRNEVTYPDLKRIAVTTGPGSFTGLRIGLSAARGLGLALGIPVVGVPSLLAISLSAPDKKQVAVLLDARRGEAYYQDFAEPGVPSSGAAILSSAEAQKRVRADAILIDSPFVDLEKLARFARDLEPSQFLPEAAYVRDADAKPQDKARIQRQGAQP